MSTQLIKPLGRGALLFPLCLVLYEFATYIGNDMIQPGMLAVVAEYRADVTWVPTSMTAYLAGGMFLQWLLGPLSDRIGRRPVMLCGVLWFIVACLATLLARNIEQFMALRFLQGVGLCFIGAVGYAAIQESFEEAVCIKITALMANVALIAPLLGPLVGAAWVHVAPWELMFVLFAFLAAVAWFGLFKSMPETASRMGERLSLRNLIDDYRRVFSDLRFMVGSVALGCASLPLLAWIAQSPVMMINDGHMNSYQYGLMQVPVFGGLVAGNMVLARLTGRYPVSRLIMAGVWPIIGGLIIALAFAVHDANQWWGVVTGLSIYAFGIGIANAGLFRLTLFASPVSKGTVSAAMGLTQTFIFTGGIEASKYIWVTVGSPGFNLLNLSAGIIWFGLAHYFLRRTESYQRRASGEPLGQA